MPKGPQGQKRPADTNACAVMVGKIATGEIKDTGYIAPGRRKSGKAGGAARAKILSKEKRQAVAMGAASARWTKGAEDMNTGMHGAEVAARSEDDKQMDALLYPCNQLGDQKRDYGDTQSVSSVLRETFFPDQD